MRQSANIVRLFAMGLALTLLAMPPLAQAHPGRTASDGCHNDRKAGIRHCHQAKTAKRTPQSNYNRSKKKSSRTTYYKNCTAARAAGATPIRRGEPGYASHLDRDNDGIACE